MAKAKIKIDMKQINKFRFWIGLGVLALFLLILTYFQMTSLAGEKEKKNYFDKMKAVKGLNDFKNEKFLPAWNEREEKLKKQRSAMIFGPKLGNLRGAFRLGLKNLSGKNRSIPRLAIWSGGRLKM